MAVITSGRTLAVAALLLCAMAAMAAALFTPNVRARYNWYNPEQIGWDLNSINAYCAPFVANKPLWWREQFGWAALCEHWGSSNNNFCGTCIKVTNRATGQWILARIVDKCSGGGLILDYRTVFKKIDTNDDGLQKGYLKVDYEFVPCLTHGPGRAEPGRM